MSSQTVPLLETIEPDDASYEQSTAPSGRIQSGNNVQREPVVLKPTERTHGGMANTQSDAESGKYTFVAITLAYVLTSKKRNCWNS